MQHVVDWLKRYKAVFLLGIAALLLLLAQSAAWVSNVFYDRATFTSIATTSFQREENREAIASSIVDRALEDRPVLRRTISEQATQLITGLLGTDLAQQSIAVVIDRAYGYVTSPNPQTIDIDLTAIKTPLSALISFAEQRGREVSVDPDSIPDTIVLYEPSDLPDIHGYGVFLLWFGPVCWLAAFGLFFAYIYRGRRHYAKRVYLVGAIIIVVSVLGLLAGPVVPPPIVASLPATAIRVIADDLIRSFLEPFVRQMLLTIVITVVTLLVFSQRFALFGLLQKVMQRGSTNAKKPKKA